MALHNALGPHCESMLQPRLHLPSFESQYRFAGHALLLQSAGSATQIPAVQP
jgi:hypothetical protein